MDRETAMTYVGHCVDDALSPRQIAEAPPDADLVRLVGWQCGFEPMFVAVWSYLPGVHLSADEAEDIAADYLDEIHWFADKPTPADYVL